MDHPWMCRHANLGFFWPLYLFHLVLLPHSTGQYLVLSISSSFFLLYIFTFDLMSPFTVLLSFFYISFIYRPLPLLCLFFYLVLVPLFIESFCPISPDLLLFIVIPHQFTCAYSSSSVALCCLFLSIFHFIYSTSRLSPLHAPPKFTFNLVFLTPFFLTLYTKLILLTLSIYSSSAVFLSTASRNSFSLLYFYLFLCLL